MAKTATKQQAGKLPDFARDGWTRSGGHLADFPKPHTRLFRDGKHRRPVNIEVSSFCEIGSIGAKHLYVKIVEVFDPLWDPVDGVWVRVWDADPEGEGKRIEDKGQFLYGKDEAAAIEWTKKQLAKHFPRKTHRYVWDDGSLMNRVRRAAKRIARDGD